MQKYGPLSYHRLGRVYPREELRLPWPEAWGRRAGFLAAVLFPSPPVVVTGLIIATRTATADGVTRDAACRGTTQSGGRA